MKRPLIALALAMAGAGAGHAQPDDLAGQMVRDHNSVRAAVGLPPVSWDVDLARQADAWARALLPTGRLDHSAREARPGQGENLAAVYGARIGAHALLGGWVAEGRGYVPGPVACEGAAWHAVGHYTQMVWRSSTRIGCGLASGPTSQVLVCRYAPPGNVCGEAPY